MRRARSPAPTRSGRDVLILPRGAPLPRRRRRHPAGTAIQAAARDRGEDFRTRRGTTAIKADVRIIASTKRNLLDKIAEGTFRQDLYYRLDVLRINIPSLREQLEDVPNLVRAPARADRQGPALPSRSRRDRDPPKARLARNIRELYHVLSGLPGRHGNITAEVFAADDAGIASAQPWATAVFRRSWTRQSAGSWRTR